ncbi:glycosyl transferase family 2 [Volucribacter psittacicida]|uniref:Glycosyl transferase family 2 n=1 Tax=Volucribacter psittacicida TaxID=203482 RepID=A0A4R1FYS3_9PAST|nr:glycosyltransferase family 2 protein [Volucribacter psittacicida]TCJ97988.1 glycosyl transferase family 2 [Volucribacter psittacicida]
MTMNIAILLATYNGKNFLKDQLYSIINNIYKLDPIYKVTIIISDDSSNDNTLNLIDKFQKDYPILLLDNSKKGSALNNFSYLIKNIDPIYDFIFFSDQDDFWLPNKMLEFLQLFEKIDNDIPTLIHSDLSVVNDKLFLISSSMFKFQKLNKYPTFSNLIVQNSITGCVTAINKQLLMLARNSNIEKSIMHDWYLGLIASSLGKIYFIDVPTILYRQHSQNEVGAKKYNIKQIIKKLINIKKNYNNAIISQNKVIEQANLFLNDFNSKINESEKENLKKYTTFYKISFINRIKLIFKGYRKFGFFRNLVYIPLFIIRR